MVDEKTRDRLEYIGPIELRGREEPIGAWKMTYETCRRKSVSPRLFFRQRSVLDFGTHPGSFLPIWPSASGSQRTFAAVHPIRGAIFQVWMAVSRTKWALTAAADGILQRQGEFRMKEDRRNHWENAYGKKTDTQLSWHQNMPAVSLELIELAGVCPTSAVIDIGGGTSRLAACLIERGVTDVTVLDLSRTALDKNKRRLGAAGKTVNWVAADITIWEPHRQYDVWHDRAVFHFLVKPRDRSAYLDRLAGCLKPGGHAVIATFALDGPEKCSGLPVARYSPDSLSRTLGDGYERLAHRFQLHETPWGSQQSFQYSLFRKKD